MDGETPSLQDASPLPLRERVALRVSEGSGEGAFPPPLRGRAGWGDNAAPSPDLPFVPSPSNLILSPSKEQGGLARRSLGQWRGAIRLPPNPPVYIYHGDADETAPPAHADLYAASIPHAKLHKLPGRDHQLNDNLAEVAADIRALT